MNYSVVVLVTCVFYVVRSSVETWEKDYTNDIHIEASLQGYSKVVLDCEEETMAVVIHLEEDFHGVIYTRGSFHIKTGPCFLDADGGKDFALKFSYKECGVKRDDRLGGLAATVIVQFDDELIFPGDLAFTFVCVDSVAVNATLSSRMKSSIMLVDPDPGVKTVESRHSAFSEGNVVVLMPKKLTPPKEEL